MTDDEEFNKEESWLKESQSYYLKLDIDTKGYIESISLPAEASNKSELGDSSAYGDARFVSDTITQDIVKFKALQDGEDARFCDFVHLVKRCYNTLKEIGIPSDMDNTHMLSIIQQKMCADDRKVWSRDLERENKPATLHGLMSWMTIEMKSRMRATAPVRTSSSSNWRTVNHVQVDGENKSIHKCWFCRDSTHWPDQCQKFAALSIDD